MYFSIPIIIPRNFIISMLRISLLSILSFNLTLSFIFLILNNKILVLSIFNDNLLIFSHRIHIIGQFHIAFYSQALK